MKNPYICCFGLFFFPVVLALADGQLDSAISGWSSQFERAQSYKYIARIELHLNPHYFKQEEISNLSPGFISFAESGGKFALDFKAASYKEAARKAVLVSYNGEQFMALNKATGNMMISRNFDGQIRALFLNHALTLPYLFAVEECVSDLSFSNGTVGDFLKKNYWVTLKERAQRIKSDDPDFKDLITYNSIFGAIDSPSKITFGLDPQKEFYPVRWKIVNSNGELIYFYSVTKVGFIKAGSEGSFLYPEIAELKFYNGAVNLPAETKLRTKKTFYIESLIINPKEVDEFIFEIDPSLARVIYDADTKSRVLVPK